MTTPDSLDMPINLTHHFLIAMPSLMDDTFSKSVVYMCEHSERGALGLVINKPSAMSMKALFEKVDLPLGREDLSATPVFQGGPVHTERGFVLHEALHCDSWVSTSETSPSSPSPSPSLSPSSSPSHTSSPSASQSPSPSPSPAQPPSSNSAAAASVPALSAATGSLSTLLLVGVALAFMQWRRSRNAPPNSEAEFSDEQEPLSSSELRIQA